MLKDTTVTMTKVRTVTGGTWEGATQWHAYIFYNGRTMWADYFTGSAITETPTAADVVSSLILDAQTLEGIDNFEDWAEELGLNPDSISDRKTYKKALKNTKQLFNVFGSDLPGIIRELQETGEL